MSASRFHAGYALMDTAFLRESLGGATVPSNTPLIAAKASRSRLLCQGRGPPHAVPNVDVPSA